MSMVQDKRKRLWEIIWKVGIVILAGLLYWVLYKNMGFHIPCLFNKATGLLCPGCGITGMCSSIFALDFKSAFLSNPGVFLSLPLLFGLIISILMKYILHGNYNLSKSQNIISLILLIYYIAYGILRNLNF